MLTFVEAGTAQAADLGYGDEAYFDALQIRLDAVAKEFDTLPAEVRANVRARLGRIQVRAHAVGWGFGDPCVQIPHWQRVHLRPFARWRQWRACQRKSDRLPAGMRRE